jgi:hypothetical protein
MSMHEFEARKVVGEDECHITMSGNGVYWSKTRIVKGEVTTPTVLTGNPYREAAMQVEPVIKRFVIAERYIPWKSIASVGTIGTVNKLDQGFTQTLRFYLTGLQEPVDVSFGLPANLAYEAMRCAIWRISN